MLKKRILIADDAPESLALMVEAITCYFPDAKIIQAINGNEARDKFLEALPCAAVLDYAMPGLTGLELAAIIRGQEKTAKIPIILVTGFSAEVVKTRAKNLSCYFMAKPVVVDDLCRQLAAAMK